MAEQEDPPDRGVPENGNARGTGEERARELERWRALIGGAELAEMLLRLEGNELVALERRVVERMAAGAVMIALDRLMMASAARLAYHAEEYAGEERLGDWIEAIVDLAIEDCVNEDAIEERDERPVAPDDPRYARLAAQLRIDARTFRRGAVVFHRMPHQDRAAFWAVFVQTKSLEQHAAEAAVSVHVARRRLERAVETFCSLGSRGRGQGGPS